jgi:hypothetical protein
MYSLMTSDKQQRSLCHVSRIAITKFVPIVRALSENVSYIILENKNMIDFVESLHK